MQIFVILLVVCHVLAQDEGFDGYPDRESSDFDGGSGEAQAEGQGPPQPGAAIIMHHQELGDDGTFKYAFQADNGLQQKESFHPDGSRTGAYSYVDPQGETVLVRYRADRHGFHILDGSSIPTTPSLTEQQQNEEESGLHLLLQQNEEDSGLDSPSYQVDDTDGGESSSAAEKSASSSPVVQKSLGSEKSRAPQIAGLRHRFYRSTNPDGLSETAAADQPKLGSGTADEGHDLSDAASSYRPYGLPRYVPSQQTDRLPYRRSPFAPLVRQLEFPGVKPGRAEAEVEDSSDPNPEHAATADNGDHSLHFGKYDDGSYERHARLYDDGSYPQHAAKYDDGSYEKYAKVYNEGQSGDAGGVGHSEYEVSESVRLPTETRVFREA